MLYAEVEGGLRAPVCGAANNGWDGDDDVDLEISAIAFSEETTTGACVDGSSSVWRPPRSAIGHQLLSAPVCDVRKQSWERRSSNKLSSLPPSSVSDILGWWWLSSSGSLSLQSDEDVESPSESDESQSKFPPSQHSSKPSVNFDLAELSLCASGLDRGGASKPLHTPEYTSSCISVPRRLKWPTSNRREGAGRPVWAESLY